MGGSFYDFDSRNLRATTQSYATKSISQNFEQVEKRRIHESMDPRKIRLRESRDSEIHPLTFPIICGMDVTGSMGKVPQMLIVDGLPKMISNIIERGVTSPALLFLAIGDSRCDKAPLQVGQFESGDAEMDMWLSRTWPEAGGGGNGGEGYMWAWYFAANHCITDAWEKRGQKGLLVTFGDEPIHDSISRTEMKEVMGIDINENLSTKDLLRKVQEKWNVYHIHLSEKAMLGEKWRELLGERLIVCDDYHKIPNLVADLAAQNCSYCGKSVQTDLGLEQSSPLPPHSGSGGIMDMPITL